MRSTSTVVPPDGTARRGPVTLRIGRWSASHPWRAIALWLVLVAACIAVGQSTSLNSLGSDDLGIGESGRADAVLHDAGLASPDSENVLITARGGALDQDQAERAAGEIGRRMRGLPEVASVAAPVRAADGSALLVQVSLRSTEGDDAGSGGGANADDVDTLLAATAQVQREHPALRIEQVGSVSMDAAVNKQVSDDLGSVGLISLPVTLLIMLLAFGAIIAAGVPVLLALSAVGAATGLSAAVSQIFPDSGSTSAMILLMGMAVGVDYSLFYVKRVREERRAGRPTLDAIDLAAETSGHSVLVSGAAVIASMLGMFLADYAVFDSLAAGSILVVAIAVVGSLTVLPAVLAKLGPRIDRPRVPILWRWSMPSDRPRLWPALLRPALRRPGWTLTVSVLLLVALAVPALGLRLQSDSAQSLPRSIPEVHTLDRLTTAFPSTHSTLHVVVEAPGAAAGEVVRRLDALARQLDNTAVFAAATGPSDDRIRAGADGRVHVLDIDAPFDPESDQAREAVAELRSTLVPTALRDLSGAHWSVGGEAAGNVDTDRHLADRLPWVVGFVVLLTLLIMGWVFRSVAIALTTAAVNLLSTGAAFGVLTLTFQHTWAEGLLGFRSTGAVINWVPLFTFAVLFGLSMDYHVFVISRIREEAQSGLPTRAAVRAGLVRSAGTVTSAAVVMVSVFSIFALMHMIEMKQLGVSLAVAVLLDAVVVRVLVLPSAMALLGRWNWWPGGSLRGGGSALVERHRTVDDLVAVEQADRGHTRVG